MARLMRGAKSVSPARAGLVIPSLDGFRAVAVLLVFGAHALPNINAFPGAFGVTIFFFLSGYLITTLMRREFDSTGTVSLRDFYTRRALRILPPFFATFLPAVAAMRAGLLVGHVDPHAVLAAVFYYANYFIIRTSWWAMPPGSGPLWSLAVEEHFYLAFPLAYLLLRSALPDRRHQAAVLLAVCAVVLGWRLVLMHQMYPLDAITISRFRMATDTRIDSILFGCVLAIWGNPVLDKPPAVPERIWKWVLFPAGLATLVASFLVRDDRVRETVRYTVQGIALYPVFITAIRWPNWGIIRVLNWRPVAFLGVLSYSFYLLHDFVVTQLESHGAGDRGRLLVGLPLTIGLSWLVYVSVERPVARLRARWMSTSRKEKPITPAALPVAETVGAAVAPPPSSASGRPR
jgi:peptidoglycan/LPS O-acetylase OafA/YrhL